MHFFELQQEARISGENQHSYRTIIQTPHRKATSVIILNFFCSHSVIEQDIYHSLYTSIICSLIKKKKKKVNVLSSNFQFTVFIFRGHFCRLKNHLVVSSHVGIVFLSWLPCHYLSQRNVCAIYSS